MNTKNRFPFTASQWQELEHQALVYKYMASGITIPPDLLFSIKRTYLDSPLSSRLLPHQPQQHFGWNYLQMGLGRKIDPEPGRCRRTDGKKWRCSKEAYPDSKYCERHMHRGKNRSRKPVEVFKSTASSTITNNASSLITKTPTTTTTTTPTQNSHCYGSNIQQNSSSFLYHHPPSRSVGFSFEDNNIAATLFLDSASYSHTNNTDCRNRYVYGVKEDVDEHAFFTEPSGSTMKSFSASSMDDSSWQLTPLTMNSSSSSSSYSSSKQRSCSDLSSDYSYLQLQCLSDQSKHHQDQHDQKTTVHRFFDEWPHNGRGSWLDLDDKSSTTQLSISIPTTTSAHDFPTFSSRPHHDG